MRLIWHSDRRSATELDDELLAELYGFGDGALLRANFVSTLDGAGTGPDRLTDSINTPADNRVFAEQRRLADAVVVGARTAHAEGYRRLGRTPEGSASPLVVVSNHGTLPARLAAAEAGEGSGQVVLVTCDAAGADSVALAREALGPEDAVWVCGRDEVDLAAMRQRLHDEGLRRLLCEGGPTLFSSLLSAGLVDEVALTLVPSLVGGDLTRITHGAGLGTRLTGRHLVEADGSIMGLWSVDHTPR
jgi:riboflavin biosynthesis pyrimidine reductase